MNNEIKDNIPARTSPGLTRSSFATTRNRVVNDICVPRKILRDTPDLSYVQPEGNYYFKTSDSYQILKSCSINISDCLKSPGTCDSSPCITTCKIKTDKNNTCKTCVMLITSPGFTSNLTGKTYYTKSFENELETIKTTLDKVVKRDDIENIVSNIMGKLVINLKKEIKQEIMAEVGKETTKMRNEYNAKILNMGGRIDVLEFDNENLLERNAELHTELKSWKEDIKEIGNRSTNAMRQGNWNEQYSRKKNVKIYNMPENRGEKLPVSLINQLKEKLDINIDRSDIVAMHRIPGRPAAPRPILIKFLRMESKIALFRRKKDISEILHVKIGDDITKQNQGLLNRLHLHDKITSAWFFNGHVFGTDEKGGRYKIDIYDNINEKIR